MSKFRIAIIGGGPSGIAILNKLASSLVYNSNLEIYMFDNKIVTSPGTPYAVDNKYAILNRSLSAMSTYLNGSQDFNSWCIENNFSIGKENLFLHRNIFGNYLFDQLSKASLILNNKTIPFFYCERLITNVELINNEKVGDVRLFFDNQSFSDFNHVICATGNFRNINPYNYQNKKGYIDNPLKINRLKAVDSNKKNPIAIIGSGLSACETAIILSKVYPNAKIIMVSNSGELPPVRGNVVDHEPKFLTIENIKKCINKKGSINTDTIKYLLNKDLSVFNTSYEEILTTDISFSQFYQNALANKTDWYNLIGTTNNIVNYSFNNLANEVERQKFRLIFNKKWIRKRIAIPIETAHELMNLLEADQLSVLKGNIQERENSFEIIGIKRENVKISYVINACGFTDKIDNNTPIYLQNFVKIGLLSTDNEGRGIVDYETCCAISNNGKSINSIQLTGASTQGTFFFTSAVDVIDKQASIVVKHLTRMIDSTEVISPVATKRNNEYKN